ncbi:MAG TPA: YfjI family protein [Roseiflexaceae bacterium]|nr:YfjI family protein [Roseiflexaceae bacterium]
MTDATSNAHHAISMLLAGAAPNGVAPGECGQWADTVQALYTAHADGGTPAVRRMFDALARTHKGLAALVAGDATGDGWPALVSLAPTNLPAFPLDILPTWLQDFAEAVTETMQTPPDLAGMLGLSILSAACARYFVVQVRPGWEEPTNVYTVTSLPPGNRKSPVFRQMTAPLVAFEQDLIARADAIIREALNQQDILQQQLEAAKREAAKAKAQFERDDAWAKVTEITEQLKALTVPSVPKMIVDDITPEALSSELAAQEGRIAALSSEGDLFAIMAGRYSSGTPNLGVFLKGHAGDPIRVDRRNRSEVIHQPALTIGITTQPDVLRSFSANAAFRGQGLLARFFYAIPKSTVGSRQIETPPIDEAIQTEYAASLRRLLVLARIWGNANSGNNGNCGKRALALLRSDSGDSDPIYFININTYFNYLYINSDGNTLIRQFELWLEPQLGEYGTLGGMSDWAAKLAGGVARVAALLHLGELVSHNSHYSQNTPEIVPADMVARALRFAEYQMAHARAAYAEIGADPALEPARVIVRWLETSGASIFTKRDCWQSVRGGVFQKAEDVDPALTLLVDHGYIREMAQEERAGPGRKPSQRYEVNPRVASHNSHKSQNTRG